MANNKKWTKEEEEILVQAIQANPHNISEALRTASATINRSFKALSKRNKALFSYIWRSNTLFSK